MAEALDDTAMELPDVEVVHEDGELRYYAQKNLIEFKDPNGINQWIPGDVFDDFINQLDDDANHPALEDIKQTAYNDGHSDGDSEGWDRGYEEGKEAAENE